MRTSDYTVAILGAGPGGTCCAAMLERLGVDAIVVERDTFPRFTIGESLLPSTLEHLEAAGLLEALEALGAQVKPGAVFHDGEREGHIRFSEARGPAYPHAYNVRRDRFDAALADAVAARGIPIRFGTTVTGASFDGSWRLTLESGGEVESLSADFVVDATGAALVARFVGDPLPEPTPARRGSVFAHLSDPRRPEGFGGEALWVASNDSPLWSWTIPFSDGTASVGFVGDAGHILEAGQSDEERFFTLLGRYAAAAERFADPTLVRFEPRSVMGYQRPLARPWGAGYCLIGNSIGFLDPVFSSGVAVATESATRAAHAIQAHLRAGGFDWQQEYAAPLLEGLAVFEGCVESWYDGSLKELIYADHHASKLREDITALLAGRAWDRSNPLTEDTAKKLRYYRRKLRQQQRLGHVPGQAS